MQNRSLVSCLGCNNILQKKDVLFNFDHKDCNIQARNLQLSNSKKKKKNIHEFYSGKLSDTETVT